MKVTNGGTHASGITKENKKYGVYLESLQIWWTVDSLGIPSPSRRLSGHNCSLSLRVTGVGSVVLGFVSVWGWPGRLYII